jgi:hypothetical protein
LTEQRSHAANPQRDLQYVDADTDRHAPADMLASQALPQNTSILCSDGEN